MSRAGQRIISGLREALAISKGEQPARSIHYAGRTYLSADTVADMREALEACAIILPRYAIAGKTVGEDEELAAVLERVHEALGRGEP